MTSPIHIRCSSLPRVVACPASLQTSEVQLGGDTDESRLGSAVHELLALRIGGKTYQIDVDAIAETWGVDSDEVRMLAGMGWQVWEEVRQFFSDPHCEIEMNEESHGLRLTGHADMVDIIEADGGLEVRILDWKSGRIDADHRDQLKGYAWLSLQAEPAASGAWVCTVRIRDRCYDGESFTREELDAWFADLAAKVHGEAYYNPGPQCACCPRRLDCPATNAMTRQAYQVIAFNQVDAIEALSADLPTRGTQLAALLEAAKVVEKLAEGIRHVVKLNVSNAGGSLPTLDGRELVIRTEERRHIDASAGWMELNAALPQGVTEVLEVRKTALEKAIRAITPRGKGAAAIRDLMERLSGAGAITTQYIEKLEIRRNGSHSNSGKATSTDADAGFDLAANGGNAAT